MRASVKREAKALVPISMAVSAPRQREQCSFRVLEEQRVKDELIEERGCICKLNAFQAKPTCSKPSAILRKGKQEPMSLQSTVYRNITAYIGDQNTFRFDRLLVSLTVVQSLNFY
ncbi:hypothetical protein H6P81_003011 [Aristolochia fimbriata]|uniref:Uncharacterized protein n=1 Tax=Aristolochia fimbriata TaxID=158543 RepID=A0AAV7FC43_ARIFI|nr:hypothetical protein H6P81_003011 [Aristolochia fimbriata]